MVYQFNSERAGTVIAEEKLESMSPYWAYATLQISQASQATVYPESAPIDSAIINLQN